MSFQNLHTVKRSHDTLLIEMENSNLQLKEEQNKSLALQNELKLGSSNQQKLVEVILLDILSRMCSTVSSMFSGPMHKATTNCDPARSRTRDPLVHSPRS